jgi:hypothetical protein
MFDLNLDNNSDSQPSVYRIILLIVYKNAAA